MSGIFLSYRRNDAAGHAGRLYDRLSAHFGPDRVFRDLDSLSYGTQFLPTIREAVGSCDSLVAVIGREWLTATSSRGERRLDDPRDFVRLEVAAALERGIPVIPVLVEGAEMPTEADLPVPLVRLCQYNGLDLSDARWDFDVGRLVSALGRWTPAVATRQAPAPEADPARQYPTDPGKPPRPAPAPAPPTLRSSAPAARAARAPRASGAPAVSARVLLVIVGGICVLGLLGLSATMLLGRGGGGGERTRRVNVAGTQPWTDSGLDLRAGDRVHITATGTVFHNLPTASSAGPDGAPDPNLRQFNVLADANHAGLLGRLGESGDPFQVGSDSTFAAPTAGRLYLGVNDRGVDNNSGAFVATVEVVGEG